MPKRKRRSISTPRQQASRIRNFNKRRLSAAHETLRMLSKSATISQYDRSLLILSAAHCKSILHNWSGSYIAKLDDATVKRIAKAGY